MKNLSLLITLSLFLSLSQVLGQMALPTAIPESVGISSERLERMEAIMGTYVDEGQLSNVELAVMRKGKLVHHSVYGKRDLETGKDIEKDDLWRIYSMTKPIVSVGLMMLYEEGKFQLNDPLHKFIPAFKDMKVYKGKGVVEPAKNPIKVVDILRHTSGFGYGWSGGYVDTLYAMVNPRGLKDNAEFVEALAKIPLYREPGTGWHYSVSTDVCGRLIEVLSGMSLDTYLKEKIFDPLDMDETFFEVPDSEDDRFVTTYSTNKEGKLFAIDKPATSNFTKTVTMFSGGGGLVSKVSDYLKFCQMMLNEGAYNGHRLLSPKTVELMISNHVGHIPHGGGVIKLPNHGSGFGLGFSMVTDLAESGMVGSKGVYGWGGAAGTVFRIDPKEDLIYLMMIQIIPYNHLQAREKFNSLVYQAIVE